MYKAIEDLVFMLGALTDKEVLNLKHHQDEGTKPLVGTKSAASGRFADGKASIPILAVSRDAMNAGDRSIGKMIDKLRSRMITDGRRSLGTLLQSLSENELWSGVNTVYNQRCLIDSNGKLSTKNHGRNHE